MIQGRCQQCGARLRFRSRRCRHCGAEHTPDQLRRVDPTGWSRTVRYLVAPLLLIGLLFATQQIVTSKTVADWYAGFALRHLSQNFSAVALTDTPTGAYNFCIRQVVRRLTPSASIETFPSSSPQNTTHLGDGRYRVASFFYEDRVDGERVRQDYTCSVRFAEGRWVLEELTPGQYARVN